MVMIFACLVFTKHSVLSSTFYLYQNFSCLDDIAYIPRQILCHMFLFLHSARFHVCLMLAIPRSVLDDLVGFIVFGFFWTDRQW